MAIELVNTLRAGLQSGRTAVGTVGVLGVESIELSCAAGFDFVLVDWQHGNFNRDQVREALRAADAAGGHAMVRPPSHDGYLIQWLADMGYLSLLVPMVNSADQAAAIVDASYYPPLGQRSQASCRASGRFMDYRMAINDQLLLLMMVETVEAVENIDAIAAVNGVGGCFLGGTDLASSMGLKPGEAKPASFEHAIEKVRRTTKDAGKIAAIAAATPEEATHRFEEGFDVVTLTTDLRMLSNSLKHARAAMESR